MCAPSQPWHRRARPAARLRTLAAAGAALLITFGAAQGSAEAAGPAVGGALLGESGVVVDRTGGGAALPAGITARSWLVADLDSGQVLAARDAHSRHRPASTLKTLTALTLLPLIDRQAQVPFTADALAQTEQPDGKSTRVGLEVGRSYAASDLFAAMIVVSANDAAEALAGAVPGGRPAALKAMNDTARALHADDTVAGTPDGLDAPDQSISAYDLALIARAALHLPDFAAYDALPVVHLAGSKGVIGGATHNRLLASYPGAYAGKDGYTSKAGQVWWGAAARDGHHLVVVVVDAGARPVGQEAALLDWGFAADGHVAPVGELVAPVPPAAPAVAQAAGGAAPLTAAGPGTRGHRGADSGVGTPWGVAAAGAAVLALFWRRARRVAGATRGPGPGRSVRPPVPRQRGRGAPAPPARHRRRDTVGSAR